MSAGTLLWDFKKATTVHAIRYEDCDSGWLQPHRTQDCIFRRFRSQSVISFRIKSKIITTLLFSPNHRKWTLRFLLLSTIPGAANLHLRNYIPTITESLGADLDQSAILQTIVGSVDLVSRLCVGLFADLHILTSVQIIIGTQIALGKQFHVFSFCKAEKF